MLRLARIFLLWPGSDLNELEDVGSRDEPEILEGQTKCLVQYSKRNCQSCESCESWLTHALILKYTCL